MVGLLLLLACRQDEAPCRPAAEVAGDGVDQDCDGVDGVLPGTTLGSQVDASFGHAVGFDGAALVVGAPFHRVDGEVAGEVTRDGSPLATGRPGDRLGATLARLDDGTWLIGAPGAGEVRDASGAVLTSGPGVGRVLASDGQRWVTSTRDGARWDDGTEVDWGEAPDALLILPDGRLVGGFARGEVALRIDTSTNVSRVSARDEAGFALALWRPGGPGSLELLVGAPGAGTVYRMPPGALGWDRPVRGDGGRFGAAIAADGAVAWVGAPMEGAAAEGAVWGLAPNDTSTRITVGETPGDQLGYALAVGPGVLAAGAPGAADEPGAVWVRAR